MVENCCTNCVSRVFEVCNCSRMATCSRSMWVNRALTASTFGGMGWLSGVVDDCSNCDGVAYCGVRFVGCVGCACCASNVCCVGCGGCVGCDDCGSRGGGVG